MIVLRELHLPELLEEDLSAPAARFEDSIRILRHHKVYKVVANWREALYNIREEWEGRVCSTPKNYTATPHTPGGSARHGDGRPRGALGAAGPVDLTDAVRPLFAMEGDHPDFLKIGGTTTAWPPPRAGGGGSRRYVSCRYAPVGGGGEPIHAAGAAWARLDRFDFAKVTHSFWVWGRPRLCETPFWLGRVDRALARGTRDSGTSSHGCPAQLRKQGQPQFSLQRPRATCLCHPRAPDLVSPRPLPASHWKESACRPVKST